MVAKGYSPEKIPITLNDQVSEGFLFFLILD